MTLEMSSEESRILALSEEYERLVERCNKDDIDEILCVVLQMPIAEVRRIMQEADGMHTEYANMTSTRSDERAYFYYDLAKEIHRYSEALTRAKKGDSAITAGFLGEKYPMARDFILSQAAASEQMGKQDTPRPISNRRRTTLYLVIGVLGVLLARSIICGDEVSDQSATEVQMD